MRRRVRARKQRLFARARASARVQDARKLVAGIQIAIDKGVIDGSYQPEPYISVDVKGKSADDVADEIIAQAR